MAQLYTYMFSHTCIQPVRPAKEVSIVPEKMHTAKILWIYTISSPLLQSIHSKDLIGNSSYCLSYSFCVVSLENLVWDRKKISSLMFFFIPITCLLEIVLSI